jgi:hypothetical protein
MPRRIDGLLKIKGMLVNPQALVDAVAAERKCWNSRQLVAKEDALAIHCRWTGSILKIVPAAEAGADLAERLQHSVQKAIGVTPDVERIAADDPLHRQSAAGSPNRSSISGSVD